MIKPITERDFYRFFSYLNLHLSKNGKDGPLFQPFSKADEPFPSSKMKAFVEGLSLPIGSSGWRRAWLAEDEAGDIVGHVDLRGRPEPHTAHRALLGMGVRSDFRRNGIGQELVNFILGWAKNSGIIEIVDLSVLSNNLPAIKLYEKLGFTRICEVDDMFRIDGRSEGNVIMAKRL